MESVLYFEIKMMIGHKWSRWYSYGLISMFYFFLLKNNNFEFFGQDLKRRRCILGDFRVEQSLILSIRLESWWAKNPKISIWFPCIDEIRTQNSTKLTAWILLEKSPSEISCQKSFFFWNWIAECSIEFLRALFTEKIAVRLRVLFLFV